MKSLGLLGDPAAGQAVARLLTDSDVSVQFAAVNSLVELGAQDQIPAPVKAIDDPDLKNWAAVALKKLRTGL